MNPLVLVTTALGRAADPDEVRDRLDEILRDAAFRRDKSWWERFLDWLEDLLGEREPEFRPPTSGSPGLLAAIGQLFIWLVIIALAVGLIWLIVMVVRGRVRKPAKRTEKPSVVLEAPELTVGEWDKLAQRYEAEGAWKEALRCRYRQLTADLAQRHSIAGVPGRTTGELRRDMAASSPDVAGPFDEVTTMFELVWYADATTDQADNARFRSVAEVVLAGARAGQFHGLELVRVGGDVEESGDRTPEDSPDAGAPR